MDIVHKWTLRVAQRRRIVMGPKLSHGVPHREKIFRIFFTSLLSSQHAHFMSSDLQVLLMVQWSQVWSVPPNLSMTSGAPRWTWRAGWRARGWAVGSRWDLLSVGGAYVWMVLLNSSSSSSGPWIYQLYSAGARLRTASQRGHLCQRHQRTPRQGESLSLSQLITLINNQIMHDKNCWRHLEV